MGTLLDILNEPAVRKEASFEHKGRTFRFAADDPSAKAAEILMADTSRYPQLATHYTILIGKNVTVGMVGQAKTILAAWDGEPTDEVELLKLVFKKPELFMAMHVCANEVLPVDPELMTYAMTGVKPSGDASNPLIVGGLGNSEGEGGMGSASPS